MTNAIDVYNSIKNQEDKENYLDFCFKLMDDSVSDKAKALTESCEFGKEYLEHYCNLHKERFKEEFLPETKVSYKNDAIKIYRKKQTATEKSKFFKECQKFFDEDLNKEIKYKKYTLDTEEKILNFYCLTHYVKFGKKFVVNE